MCRQLDSLPGRAGTGDRTLPAWLAGSSWLLNQFFPPNWTRQHSTETREQRSQTCLKISVSCCVCYLSSKYLVFEPQFTALMQVFATSRSSQVVGQWAQHRQLCSCLCSSSGFCSYADSCFVLVWRVICDMGTDGVRLELQTCLKQVGIGVCVTVCANQTPQSWAVHHGPAGSQGAELFTSAGVLLGFCQSFSIP